MLTNRKNLRAHILRRAELLRYHLFTCVAKETLEKCEARLTNYIDEELQKLPSKGKTIRF